jgi:hypothetical protein
MDPDGVLRGKLPEFVAKGDFGLASGPTPDGGFARVWWNELVPPDEIGFDADVFLLTKGRAKALKAGPEPMVAAPRAPGAAGAELATGRTGPAAPPTPQIAPGLPVAPPTQRTLRITGTVPPEIWNRLGTRLIPKLKMGSDLQLSLNLSVRLGPAEAESMERDLRQALADLGLPDRLHIAYE